MILLVLAALIASYWLFQATDPATASARAGMLQGLVAAILLVVTWLSIGKADEQIALTTEILGLESRHNLAVDLDEFQDKIHLVNLSKLPLYVREVRYEVLALRLKSMSIGERVVLGPAEKDDFVLQGIYEPFDPEDPQVPYEVSIEEYQQQLDSQWERRYIRVTYQYSATGDQVHTKLFAVVPEALYFRSEEPRTWRKVLVPLKDYETPLEGHDTPPWRDLHKQLQPKG
ncbi:hypothetical protein [Deinococcus multiflagellatus]|uniref:Uncharacterized protein n=1 Tax=Deinococcus multiflagellatus TaxID=1656887 RepID=A0ABW1ZRA0_9DEIO|nr:hypothetical protein [Deinococcus multiflagellatus]MBZ9715379.1 hypothetical protein [Deinococcus multiflagellatus]